MAKEKEAMEEIVRKFNEMLEKEKWDLPKCPVCKVRNWTAAEKLVEFRPFTGGGLVVGAPVYPAIMIICQDCGYTMFFNAALIGLV